MRDTPTAEVIAYQAIVTPVALLEASESQKAA